MDILELNYSKPKNVNIVNTRKEWLKNLSFAALIVMLRCANESSSQNKNKTMEYFCPTSLIGNHFTSEEIEVEIELRENMFS